MSEEPGFDGFSTGRVSGCYGLSMGCQELGGFFRPFFFGGRDFGGGEAVTGAGTSPPARKGKTDLTGWMAAVERTVTGMGYDLVDAERSAGGLLRVTIDRFFEPDAVGVQPLVNVDDCERVTRQLQHVLEVEACPYERLEVSSPGLDRPLKKPSDYERFAGEAVELTLKQPFQGRKKYRGVLQASGGGWRLLLDDDRPQQPRSPSKRSAATKTVGKAVGKPPPAGDPAAPRQALEFALDEVRDARLVPVIDFKGRRSPSLAEAGPTAADLDSGARLPDDNTEGGRIQ